MNLFKKLTIGRRIFYGYAAVAVLFIIFFAGWLLIAKVVKNKSEQMVSVFEASSHLIYLKDKLQDMAASDLNLREENKFFIYEKDFNSYLNEVKTQISLPGEDNSGLLLSVEEKVSALSEIKKKILVAHQYDNEESVKEYSVEFAEAADSVENILTAILGGLNNEYFLKEDELSDTLAKNTILVLFVSLAGTVICFLTAYFTKKSINKLIYPHILEITNTAKSISSNVKQSASFSLNEQSGFVAQRQNYLKPDIFILSEKLRIQAKDLAGLIKVDEPGTSHLFFGENNRNKKHRIYVQQKLKI